MKFLKENKKIVIPVGIVIAFFAINLGIFTAQVHSNKIAKNVYISGVKVGGLTQEEAIKKISNEKKFNSLKLYYGKKEWDVPSSDIGFDIDYKGTVANAYNYNKSNGYFSNIARTLKSDYGKKTVIPMEFGIKRSAIEEELDDIKKEIDSPTKNATISYIDKKVVLEPSVSGKELDIAMTTRKIMNNLKEDKFKTELVVKKAPAKFTEKDLEGIDTLLGSYKTIFGGMPSRDYNIAKAARDSSGVLLKPGEEYSFNNITGEKTLANGYKNAPVIESGQLVLGTGGGVCQTSTTIFNAALYAGMEITSRRNHTIPSDYVSLGRDATVFDGPHGQDFRFKNPFKHPVYVKNFTAGNKLISEIFGSKEDEQNIEIVTQNLGGSGGSSKTIQDPTLPLGKKVVEKYARPSRNIITYRVYMDKNGNKIRTEKVGTSTYPGQEGIIRVGTGGASSVTTATSKNGVKNNTLYGQNGVASGSRIRSNSRVQNRGTINRANTQHHGVGR